MRRPEDYPPILEKDISLEGFTTNVKNSGVSDDTLLEMFQDIFEAGDPVKTMAALEVLRRERSTSSIVHEAEETIEMSKV